MEFLFWFFMVMMPQYNLCVETRYAFVPSDEVARAWCIATLGAQPVPGGSAGEIPAL